VNIIDFKKELKHLYQPSVKHCVMIDVPIMNFLKIDVQGDPNTSQSFQEAIEALYSMAYTLKFMLKKKGTNPDYVVPPLEGLWWTDNMAEFSLKDKDNWKWQLMIMQPEFVTSDLVEEAKKQVKRKKNPAALELIYFGSYDEGKAAQIMHLGPFSDEGPTIEKLHQFIKTQGYTLRGKHHEIYLSDPRKSDSAKMKTVIRQPVG